MAGVLAFVTTCCWSTRRCYGRIDPCGASHAGMLGWGRGGRVAVRCAATGLPLLLAVGVHGLVIVWSFTIARVCSYANAAVCPSGKELAKLTAERVAATTDRAAHQVAHLYSSTYVAAATQ